MENTNPEMEMEVAADRKKSPPSNDCCPICFGDFTVPCRSLCDHWFCDALHIFRWNRTFEHVAVTLVYILQMIGILLRRRRLQRLRHLPLNDNN